MSADMGNTISGLLICDGCGCTTTDAELTAQREARPGLISCCPERKMRPATREDWDKLHTAKDAAPVSAGKVKALDYSRIRAALSRACLMLSGEEALTKLSVEAHLREMLDCINLVDEAAKAAAQADAEARILSALQPGDGWQGGESAPKDGTPILLYVPGYPGEVQAAVWNLLAGRGWCMAGLSSIAFPFDKEGVKPTHWMPFPDPPASLPPGGAA